MKTEEAIDLLEDIKFSSSDYPRDVEALEMAIESLKKQIRRLVIDVSVDYADTYEVSYEAECPACGFYFEPSDNSWEEPYCPHCGQALNWEVKRWK